MDNAEEQSAVREWLNENLVRLPLASVADAHYVVAIALKMVHGRLFELDLSVAVLLEQCQISPSSFYSHFRQHCSLPPGRYIWFLRMEAARLIISERPDFRLGAISYGLGYSNYETFARAFKRSHGEPPSVYRDKFRQK